MIRKAPFCPTSAPKNTGKSQKRVVKQWNRLPRTVLESPSLGAFQKRVAVAPEDVN